MSYILDALRKAEAQRKRGTVPGLHTPPLGEGPGTGAAGAAGPRRWTMPTMAAAGVMGAVGLALLVALAGGWRPGAAPKAPTREPRAELEPQATGSRAPAAAAGPGAAGAAAPPASPNPTMAARPVAMPATPAESTASAPAMTPEPRPPIVPAPSTAGPTAVAQSPSAATPPGASLGQVPGLNPARGTTPSTVVAAPSAPASQATLVLRGGALSGGEPGGPAARPVAAPTPSPTAPPSAPPSAAATEPRVYKPAELPPEIRQQLPSMTVGGAMHSENAASRMLILNGQLYREGEQPAPGITLERIQLRSAVLVFKGWRYEIAY